MIWAIALAFNAAACAMHVLAHDWAWAALSGTLAVVSVALIWRGAK